MNKQLIRKILYVVSIILFAAMAATVAYNYASMECAIAHQGASAPANIAFLTIIPFVVVITVCLIIGRVLKEKK